jgi:hypothetical protein
MSGNEWQCVLSNDTDTRVTGFMSGELIALLAVSSHSVTNLLVSSQHYYSGAHHCDPTAFLFTVIFDT